MIDTVLFDMGGTLEDIWVDDESRHSSIQGVLDILRAHGIDLNMDFETAAQSINAGWERYGAYRDPRQRELKPEDALLVLIAFAAACALFPHGWTAYWSTSAEALFPRLAWQWLLFALLAGWVVLRLLRRFSGGDTQELLKLFRALLILAAAYFVFEVCFAEFAGLFSTIDALKAGNTAFTADTVLPVSTDITGSRSLVFSYVVLALRFAAESLPSLLAAATAYFAVGLLDTMESGAFTQESAAYAPKLAEWCVKVLKLSVLFALAVNILQAVCAPLILSTSISIRLPVLELCFVLAALLGARLIASNVALAADNDLFI